ncbi:MAG: efflux RND transporter permease subunit [Candidatus Neomarinimicrobiota bacterium]
MNIAKFSVKNSVFVNMLMMGLFVFGALSFMQLPRELNPNIDFNWIFITVVYPGAAPTETENLIVDPIEDEIKDIENISEIQSTSGEGFGFLLVKFEDMSQSKFSEKLSELKTEIDKVSLPEDAEDPLVDDFSSSDFQPVITINLTFSIPEENAFKIADELEERLIDIPGIAQVQVSGLAEREIWIEVDPSILNSYHVSFDEIAMALRIRNLNIPGGNISIGKTEYLIRSIGEYQSVEEIGNTIIRTSQSGEFIKIKDVATVNDTREELQIYSRLDGKQSITFSLSKKSNANSLDTIDEIKIVVNEFSKKVPDGVFFSYTMDNSIYINRVLNVLRNNALIGMVIIIFVLYIFLGKRNAMLASLGIPISFFITFIFMQMTGYSLNGSTLFALVMVLGIIVDDAIIVIENCHRYRLKGYNSVDSAILGTKEVVSPILSSIGTNIAAFLPLILLTGIMGKFMRIIPLVFSLALLASLFEAFFLLPSHYADWTLKSKEHKKGDRKFFIRLKKGYRKLLFKILRKRYFVISALVVILIISFGVIPLVGVEMFGEEDFDQFKVLLKFPEGTSLEETNRIVKKFEVAATKIPQEPIDHIITNVGLLQANEEWLIKKNVAQILFQLEPQENRKTSTKDMMKMMQSQVKNISGPTSIEFEEIVGGPPVGKDVSIKVQGKYLTNIKKAALALQDSLKLIDGVDGITDDFPAGKNEINIIADEEKAALYGFNIQTISMFVRSAFDGIKATEYRDADEEIDVIVKYNVSNRQSMEDVLNLRVINQMGQTVALRDIVKFEIKPGPTEIKRFDQKRTIMVTANIDKNIITIDKVDIKLKGVFLNIEKQFPGVTVATGGQFEEFSNTFKNIGSLFILSLIIIFLILGTQFNSYTQPIIILTTVPFAMIGAMLGLLISGNPFSIVSMFGFVALAGIVVNDAIVMISFVNNRRRGEHISANHYWKSIVDAGQLRLRPIILTSLTTTAGLLPMAFGIGGSSGMWAPLANVILFGLLISTVLTLFVIPCFLAILDDLKKNRKKALIRQHISH